MSNEIQVGDYSDILDEELEYEECKRDLKTPVIMQVYGPVNKSYCYGCDGCGWYEGGPTLITVCEQCNGTGYES